MKGDDLSIYLSIDIHYNPFKPEFTDLLSAHNSELQGLAINGFARFNNTHTQYTLCRVAKTT